MEGPHAGEASSSITDDGLDLGGFRCYEITSSWWVNVKVDNEEIMISGSSEAPTEEQKRLIDRFVPLLGSLAASSAIMLQSIGGAPDDIPRQLVLGELRLESSGLVQLLFDLEVEMDNERVWPMATCSPEGKLLSIEWIV